MPTLSDLPWLSSWIPVLSGSMIFLGLCMFAVQAVEWSSKLKPSMRPVVLGVLFSTVGIMAMQFPFPVGEAGLPFDYRNVLIAGAFIVAGPVAGITAGVASSTYRIVMGGDPLVGLLTIVLSTLVSAGVWYFSRNYRCASPVWMAAFGIGLALSNSVVAFVIPDPATAWMVFETYLVWTCLLYPPVMVLFGVIIRRELERRDSIGRLVTAQQSLLQERDRADQLRREAEQALFKAEEANRAKSRFLATMSHELRTPLNAIMGFSQSIGQGVLGPVQPARYREYANDIHKSAAHLFELLTDILDMSRLDAKTVTLDCQPISINSELDSSLVLVDHQASTHTIINSVDPDLPYLVGDGRAIRQILINLITNSIKYTPPHGTIEIFAHEKDGQIEFGVSDNGIGMEPDLIDRLMRPFQRAEDPIVATQSGVGLGLSICHALTELMGGQLDIESLPRSGTRVTVRLPIWRDPKSLAEAA